MSSPHMSFRLNNYQLAKALRILLTLEPNQPITSLSQVAKTIIIDWISKHSINSSLEVSQADINAIKLINNLHVDQIDPYSTVKNIMDQARQQDNPFILPQTKQQMQQRSALQIQRDLDDEKLLQELKREGLAKQAELKNQSQHDAEIDEQIRLAEQMTKRVMCKPSEFHDPNITDSVISTVTDFSPPKEWIDSEE